MNLPDTGRLQQARTYWLARSARERLLLGGAAFLTVAAVLYAGIWAPLNRELVSLRRAIPEARIQLATMQQQAAGFNPAQIHPANNSSMIATVEQQLRELQLQNKVARLDGDGEQRLTLEMTSAPFDLVARLIATLEDSGMAVARADIERASEPGVVHVKLELGHL
jgi:type II secretory pathway component PulM